MPAPEAVAIGVEVCYQHRGDSLEEQLCSRNTGLAMAIALSFFDEEHASRAAGVPLYYAVVQVTLGLEPGMLHFKRISWTRPKVWRLRDARSKPLEVHPAHLPTCGVEVEHDLCLSASNTSPAWSPGFPKRAHLEGNLSELSATATSSEGRWAVAADLLGIGRRTPSCRKSCQRTLLTASRRERRRRCGEFASSNRPRTCRRRCRRSAADVKSVLLC